MLVVQKEADYAAANTFETRRMESKRGSSRSLRQSAKTEELVTEVFPYIVGGEVAVQGEFPWFVGSNGLSSLCGGERILVPLVTFLSIALVYT